MAKNLQSGQGLVEYALILVLISLVVIAVLALLGPAVAQSFNNITKQVGIAPGTPPTPTPPVWTFCANENGTCSFSGTHQVRYGKNSSWYYGTYTNSVACSNTVFGDPIYGTYKECDYQ